MRLYWEKYTSKQTRTSEDNYRSELAMLTMPFDAVTRRQQILECGKMK